MRRIVRNWLLVAFGAAGLVGCNSLTGAGDVRLDDDDSVTGVTTGATSGAGGNTSGVGQGTSTGVGGNTSSTGAGGEPPTEQQGAVGVEVTGVRIYQGPERVLIENRQQQTSNIPLVPGRPALMRVFFNTNGDYNQQAVTARVSFGGDVSEQSVVLNGSSSASNLTSTVNFELDGTQLDPTLPFRVELLQSGPNGAQTIDNPVAHFPEVGTPAMALPYDGGHKLKVMIVPIRYDADGSQRLPDISPAHLEQYRKELLAHYPVSDVELTVRETVSTNSPVNALDGNQWVGLRDGIADLRQSDGAPPDTFYYGVFNPAASRQAYCQQGCIQGIAFIPSAADNYGRAAIGLGFSGVEDTLTHELGHCHGRMHVNGGCGAQGTDPSYPVSGGFIEQPSYNIVTGAMAQPQTHKDFMTYCNPVSIGEYGYGRLYDRVNFIHTTQIMIPQHLRNRRWARLRILPSGDLQWYPSIVLATPPMGSALSVEVEDQDQTRTVDGQYMPNADVEGGTLFVLDSNLGGLSRVRANVAGHPVQTGSHTPVTQALVLSRVVAP